METSPRGRNLIKSRETKRLRPYDDQHPIVLITSQDQVKGKLTVGWGHTGPDVIPGQCISDERAEELFSTDIAEREQQLTHIVKVAVTQNQWDALMCLMYNVGSGHLAGSTLLRELNLGRYSSAAEHFLEWDHDNGKVMPGLLTRREIEKDLFEESQTN